MRSVAQIDGELAECRQRITELETERRQAAEAERRQEIEQRRLDEADAAVLQRLEDGDDLCVRPPTGAWWARLGEMVERADGRETAAADRLYQRGQAAMERRSVPAAGLYLAIYTVREAAAAYHSAPGWLEARGREVTQQAHDFPGDVSTALALAGFRSPTEERR